jgi:hypothetical protein
MDEQTTAAFFCFPELAAVVRGAHPESSGEDRSRGWSDYMKQNTKTKANEWRGGSEET